MIFEVLSTLLMGGISLKAHMNKSGVGNDSKKLQKIFTLSGLNVKDGSQTLTTQLIKKRNYDWGTEYRYRIPLGRSFEDYQSKLKTIESGINTRSVKIEFKDIRGLKLDRNIIANVKGLRMKKLTARKEVELSYDGLLIIKVFNNPFPTIVNYQEGLTKGWEVVVGESRNGTIKHDFEKKPHIIVAGTTDFGKSNWVNVCINTLLQNKKNDLKLTLIDLKGGLEFSQYKDLPQVIKLATDPQEALEALEDAVEQMEETMKHLLKTGARNIQEAGRNDRHFIVIDEAADLADDKKCQELLKDIARKGRAAGLRLIYTTQYPTVETISSQVKRNCIGRLCFVLDTGTASTVVLDQKGAESLPLLKGRALYKDVKLIEVQTPLITSEIIQKTIDPLIKGGQVHETPKRTTRKDTVIIEKTRLS